MSKRKVAERLSPLKEPASQAELWLCDLQRARQIAPGMFRKLSPAREFFLSTWFVIYCVLCYCMNAMCVVLCLRIIS